MFTTCWQFCTAGEFVLELALNFDESCFLVIPLLIKQELIITIENKTEKSTKCPTTC